MEDQEIRSRIRAFLTSFFANLELRDNEDIFALGFINSLFAMQLVLFIEKEFGFVIDNEDLDIDNFRSIDVMSALIARRTSIEVQS